MKDVTLALLFLMARQIRIVQLAQIRLFFIVLQGEQKGACLSLLLYEGHPTENEKTGLVRIDLRPCLRKSFLWVVQDTHLTLVENLDSRAFFPPLPACIFLVVDLFLKELAFLVIWVLSVKLLARFKI